MDINERAEKNSALSLKAARKHIYLDDIILVTCRVWLLDLIENYPKDEPWYFLVDMSDCPTFSTCLTCSRSVCKVAERAKRRLEKIGATEARKIKPEQLLRAI